MKRVLLCAALLAWSGLASAVVYKWVDAHGKIQYGDRPPDGVHAEIVELLGTHPGSHCAGAPLRPSGPEPSKNRPPGYRGQAGRGAGRRLRPGKTMRRSPGPLQEAHRGPPVCTRRAPTASAVSLRPRRSTRSASTRSATSTPFATAPPDRSPAGRLSPPSRGRVRTEAASDPRLCRSERKALELRSSHQRLGRICKPASSA